MTVSAITVKVMDMQGGGHAGDASDDGEQAATHAIDGNIIDDYDIATWQYQ